MLTVLNYPALFVGRIVALIVALSVHEFAHALVALQLGDRTAERSGRLTLNPLAHLDPIGSLMMITVGFGWAKPVPVNPANLRGDRLRSMGITAAAGPISNILQAFVFALPIRFGLVDFDWGVLFPSQIGSDSWLPSMGLLLSLLVWMNLLLAVFNLIPLGPLDGMKVLLGILPSELAYRLEPLARYGSLLLLMLIIWGGGLIGELIFPPALHMLGLLTGISI
jgi:Zn-dependent protease